MDGEGVGDQRRGTVKVGVHLPHWRGSGMGGFYPCNSCPHTYIRSTSRPGFVRFPYKYLPFWFGLITAAASVLSAGS